MEWNMWNCCSSLILHNVCLSVLKVCEVIGFSKTFLPTERPSWPLFFCNLCIFHADCRRNHLVYEVWCFDPRILFLQLRTFGVCIT